MKEGILLHYSHKIRRDQQWGSTEFSIKGSGFFTEHGKKAHIYKNVIRTHLISGNTYRKDKNDFPQTVYSASLAGQNLTWIEVETSTLSEGQINFNNT